MEPVRELDEDDAQVLRECEHHLAHVLRSIFHAAVFQAAELRHAIDEERDLIAELLPDRFERHAGILNGIVQKPRRDRRVVHPPLAQDLRGRKDVVKVRFAAFPLLALVGFLGECVRPRDQAGWTFLD